MKLLLDTHVLLWWILDSPSLSHHARSLIGDSSNSLWWSAASSWEISIKYALGRLSLPDRPDVFVPAQLALNGVQSLAILDSHALQAGQLPLHHKDPFDRMLVAQTLVESLVIVSSDSQLSAYGIVRKW